LTSWRSYPNHLRNRRTTKPRRVRATCTTGRLCASSLIRSLRSVMRLRRALQPQSCGKPRHCGIQRGK
ncbi:hypothetical protein C9130_24955, partial (plasmid) [Escherichia coli]